MPLGRRGLVQATNLVLTILIAGFNDKHLDFRVSVISQNGKIFLATWVHTNNIVGQFYLKVILPFDILIVRNALTRVSESNLNKYS
jgi:hypothetical protein